MNAKERERQEAIAQLREWLKPGDTVYTILRHVSRSGMSRHVSVVVFRDSRPMHPNWSMSKAVGFRLNRSGRDAIVVGGCGFDAGHSIVYDTAATLWRDGFGCIGEGCPSNDHSNGDRNYEPSECAGPHRADEGHNTACHWHKDGGYALRQEWL